MKNILLITIDDLRYDYSHIITEKFREVLGPGIEFENAYCTGTSSIFSFLGILCSKYSIDVDENMKYDIKKDGRAEVLYELDKEHKRIYLSEIFKKNGYSTYAIANAPHITDVGYKRTIDKFVSGYTVSNKEQTIAYLEKIFSVLDNNGLNTSNLRKGIYRQLKSLLYGNSLDSAPYCSAEEISRLIKEFVEKNKKKPIFIQAHFLELHTPFFYNKHIAKIFTTEKLIKINRAVSDSRSTNLSKKDLELYKKMYSSQAEYIAANLKDLLLHLKIIGFLEDTIIVLTADHGQFFGEKNMPCGHGVGALRSEKDLITLLHAEVTHVPLVIYGKTQKKIKKVVSQIDLAPTILDFFGNTAPSVWYGENLLNNTNRPVISEIKSELNECYAVRTDDWVLLYEEKTDHSLLYKFGLEDSDKSVENPDVVNEMKSIITLHKNRKKEKWREYLKLEIRDLFNKKNNK